MQAELEKMSKELAALDADMKTRKPGSEDYIKLAEEMTNKDALLKARKQFYQELLTAKDQRWTEDFYREILQVAAEVAVDKGLDIVLEKDEPELPAANPTELMLVIRTHKVLYSAAELDITKLVIAEIDSRK